MGRISHTSLYIRRGDTEVFDITARVRETGDAIDLTGTTVYFTMKKDLDDTDAAATFQSSWTSHTDPTNGVTKLTITATQTRQMSRGTYFYDIQVVDGDVVSTINHGTVEVIQDVTTSS